jgi:fluoroacetyl-CoA thioesterase
MKDTLKAGLRHTTRFEVTRDRTIDFMGEKARVYATPMLVRDIEIACREMLLAHLSPGEDSVGTRVELDHTGATLMGMAVTIEIEIASVEGRAVKFNVTASDNIEPICKAAHHRFIVDVAKTEQRLAAKAAKAGLA